MSIGSTLFPPANREAAIVAWLRTFWQVVRGTSILGGLGIITVSAAQLQHIDLLALAYVVGAILVSAILSATFAAGDILVHGLPTAYSNAAIAAVPAAIVTPSDPSQPAAGTPPAVVIPVAPTPQPEADPNGIEPVAPLA